MKVILLTKKELEEIVCNAVQKALTISKYEKRHISSFPDSANLYEEMLIDVRGANALLNNGITTIGDLKNSSLTLIKLRKMRGVGHKTVREIEKLLNLLGMGLPYN